MERVFAPGHREYVCVAPSDDTTHPQFIERLTAPLEAFPELKIAVCNVQTTDENSEPAPDKHRPRERFSANGCTRRRFGTAGPSSYYMPAFARFG